MNYSYSNDFIDGGAAIHRYDYDKMNKIDPSYHFDDIIRWIVRTINAGVRHALNLAQLNDSGKKFQGWKSSAMRFATPSTEKKPITWAMLCCRYGYAIEQYVNEHISSHPYADEFSVSTQSRRGQTIPDIVVSSRGEEIAWVDITSENSVCHIYKKKGGKWTTAPVVIELAYPALTFSQISFT
ncbi:MAG: hypothetical protein K2N36_03120 [Ruminiclostridium sp.]|nr:hypothetical protein [Ruminiclostridium sp.]